jgi:hypothetical protein
MIGIAAVIASRGVDFVALWSSFGSSMGPLFGSTIGTSVFSWGSLLVRAIVWFLDPSPPRRVFEHLSLEIENELPNASRFAKLIGF